MMALIASLQSCLSPKKLYYFHDQTESKQRLDSLQQPENLKIKKGDRLQIVVTSPDPSVTLYLNPYSNNYSTGGQIGIVGYLVDSTGSIIFPHVGVVKIDEMTTRSAAELIREKLLVYYKDIFVNVNIYGKVYFLNGREGKVIQMYNERMTIFEAIVQSGVQDPYDIKNKVWLVREENGERIHTQLDLNSKTIFESPYYYLHNNDLIYLKPGKLSSLLAQNSPARVALTFSGALLTAIFLILRLR
jgi:polysaccharide export outer membrane protein